MSRIVYIECRDGRPALDEEGIGCCAESLTCVEGLQSGGSDNWSPYVPESDYSKWMGRALDAEERVRELEGMAERDAYAQASDHWHDEADRLRVERDNLRKSVRELEDALERAKDFDDLGCDA